MFKTYHNHPRCISGFLSWDMGDGASCEVCAWEGQEKW